ncbi:MAG: mechanosensitive ion channel domain-containing protein, partial [Acidiferrobacterales bacterium]
MSYLHNYSLKVLSAVFAIWLIGGSCPYSIAAGVTELPGSDKTTNQGLSDAELAALAGELTPEERMALLARLSDSQVRELLIHQLDKAATTRAADEMSMTAGMLGTMHSRSKLIRNNLRRILSQAQNLPTVLPFAIEKLTEGRSKTYLIWIVLGMAVMFAAGAGAEWLLRRLVIVRVERESKPAQLGRLGSKLGYCGLRVLCDLLALAVFALVAIGAYFAMYHGHVPSRQAVNTYFAVVMIVRLASLISRALFAPAEPALRMIPLSDDNARYLHKCVVWFVALASFGVLTGALLQLLGLEPDSLQRLVGMIVALVLVGVLIGMIWRGRRAIADLIRGEPRGEAVSRARRIFAETWHLLAIVGVFGIYITSLITRLAGHDLPRAAGLLTLLIIVATPLADAGIRRALTSFFATRGTNSQAIYEPVIRRSLRIVLALLVVITLAELWGINVFSMAETGIGAEATRAVLDIGLTLLIGYVGWQIAKTAINRRLAPEPGEAEVQESGGEVGGEGLSRVQTLLPLFRRFLYITIVVMVTMIVLSQLGVNIGPLIAGAGVIGLAIGFGAQTLVRDIMSGMFYLIDDAFRLGEYVDIGSVKGVVEKINVRSLVLRHHRGPLNTVPFGEIQHLTNYSRDWAIMKLEFRVTYDT